MICVSDNLRKWILKNSLTADSRSSSLNIAHDIIVDYGPRNIDIIVTRSR